MKRLILSALLVCALITGCTAPAPAPEAETAEPDETAAALPEPEPVLPERLDTEKILPEVRSNGGFFVGVGNKIWFRHYLDSSYGDTALFGEFLGTESAGDSDLWYYDEKGDALVDALPDYGGVGGLWYSGDGFFVRRHNSEGQGLYHIRLDGTVRYWGRMEVCGASEDSRYVAVRGWSDGGYEIAVIRDAAEKAEAAVKSMTADFIGFVGSYSLWRVEGGIISVDGDTGEAVRLGDLPEPEYDVYTPEFSEPAGNGKDFFVMLGWYAGTGHFLQETVLLAGTAGAEGSLHEAEQSDGRWYDLPYLSFDSGSLTLSIDEKRAGLAELSGGGSGDLILWTDAENHITLVRDFITGSPYEDGGFMIQSAERIGDAVYMAVAGAARAPMDDIGWRSAYRLVHMTYIRVPAREDATPEYFFNDSYIENDLEELVYTFTGAWTPVVRETDGVRTAVEAAKDEGIYILDNGTITVKLGEYENVFRFTEPVWMDSYGLWGESKNGDTCWCRLDDTYMWCTVQQLTETGSEAWSVGCR